MPYQGISFLPEPAAIGFDYTNFTALDSEAQRIIRSLIMNNANVTNLSGQVAEGNMVTTPDDLAHWIQALLTGKSQVTKDYVNKMMSGKQTSTSSNSTYGYGIMYSVELEGYGHNGARPSFLTLMLYDPKTEISAALFISVTDFSDNNLKGLSLLSQTYLAAKEILR
jgi:D-alanyl-D-alanine carboxypeptidase